MRINRLSLAISAMVFTLFFPLCLISCAPDEPQEIDFSEADIIRVSIQNGAQRDIAGTVGFWDETADGLAARVGEFLKTEGFVFENGYTIDISNSDAKISDSFILIPEDDSVLENEALLLHEVLGFPIEINTARYNAKLKFNDSVTNERAVLIILGSDCRAAPRFSKEELSTPSFADEDMKKELFQIEPYPE